MTEAGRIKIALAGNPNCGKTTIFNNITGAKQHVGNYPGVTVEKKEGHCTVDGKELLFIDLPGTYSLTARSLDEVVARNVIINDKPDIIVNVLDASNLERNLYLAAQIIELGCPVVVALNMMDIAQRMGIEIDLKKLGKKLGAVVVPLIGSKNIGTKELLQTLASMPQQEKRENAVIDYGSAVEPYIARMTDALKESGSIHYPLRWLAVKLLENDSDVIGKVKAVDGTETMLALADSMRSELQQTVDLDFYFAQCRHQFAVDAFNGAIVESGSTDSLSDRIDAVLTNRWLGLPIFFVLMWVMFNAVINLGAYPQGWLESGFGVLGDYFGEIIADEQLRSLVVDGVIGGVGAVISFVPLIVLLYLFIGLLEDSGYMARAAFLIDRIMRAFGLHGKSFIPMILDFGCNVPGIMAARTLDNEKDRMVTILASPFMSCSARLPVYTLFIAAFFGATGYGGTVLFGLYVLGIVVAILVAIILRKTVFSGEQEPFVMEMPPYHVPTLRGVLMHMWERSILYLKKAGTIILGASILVWFLTAYPMDVDYTKDYDAARASVTAQAERDTAALLTTYGLTATDEDGELQTMLDEMTAAAEDEKAAAEEEQDVGSVADAEALQQKSPYPEAFAALAAENPVAYEKALPLFTIQQDADEAIAVLDEEETSEKLSQSYAARLGHFIEPVIAPLGFDWKIGVGIVACTAAKEVMVSTLATIYSVEADDAHQASLVTYLANDSSFNPAIALSLMVFSLLYMPCIAALAVIKRETNSWKWMGFSAGLGLALAYGLSFITYHLALLAGLGA
ncbi:ferrous iron transport protein B [Megasphaera vaginalis (ex Srinivasan et al. 2021)]|uniref:Ferrous iron transport protein B n=1 Tax=Megasphaera vaginalis (ex Srinivasan et al. 2021) TaxID=1111454 RepID=U7UGD6_9FIRM|nr:ferrous iron transport protein B [Megasphaera vaginalis (ex Srinivasan et al. 2021)]ERT58410.1 ferrous iron transport protein B [Megasphaera vaginalis (ex Srinivasan et al. 2021)]